MDQADSNFPTLQTRETPSCGFVKDSAGLRHSPGWGLLRKFAGDMDGARTVQHPSKLEPHAHGRCILPIQDSLSLQWEVSDES